jgi:hypothetical protein
MSKIEITERTNVVDSFKMARYFLSESDSDLNLKWFVISFHHAIYVLMLYALVKTSGDGIWVVSSRRREDGTIDIFDEKSKLISFMKAFDLIQKSENMSGVFNGKPFKAEGQHETNMMILNNNLRNKLVHYKPISWRIEKSFIYDVCDPILDIAYFLIDESKQCFFVGKDLESLKRSLDDIKSFFENNKTS